MQERYRIFQLTYENAEMRRKLAQSADQENSLRQQISNKNEQFYAVLKECKRVKIVNARRMGESRLLKQENELLRGELLYTYSARLAASAELSALSLFRSYPTAPDTVAHERELLEKENTIQALYRALSDAQASAEAQRVFEGFDEISQIKIECASRLKAALEQFRGLYAELYSMKAAIAELDAKCANFACKGGVERRTVGATQPAAEQEIYRLRAMNAKLYDKLKQNYQKPALDTSLLSQKIGLLEQQITQLEARNCEYEQKIYYLSEQRRESARAELQVLDMEIEQLPSAQELHAKQEDELKISQLQDQLQRATDAYSQLQNSQNVAEQRQQQENLLTSSVMIHNIGDELQSIKQYLAHEMQVFARHFDQNQLQIDSMVKQLMDDAPGHKIIEISNYDENEITKLWENNRTMADYLHQFVRVDKIMIKYLRKYSENMGNDKLMAEDMQYLIAENASLQTTAQKYEQQLYQLLKLNTQLSEQLQHPYENAPQISKQQYDEREKLFATKYDSLVFKNEELKEQNEELDYRATVLELQLQENQLVIAYLEEQLRYYDTKTKQKHESEAAKTVYNEQTVYYQLQRSVYANERFIQQVAALYERGNALERELEQEKVHKQVLAGYIMQLEQREYAEVLRQQSAHVADLSQTQVVRVSVAIYVTGEEVDFQQSRLCDKLKLENEVLSRKIQRMKQNGTVDLTVSQLSDGYTLQQSQNYEYLLMIYELKHQNNLLKLKIEEMFGKYE